MSKPSISHRVSSVSVPLLLARSLAPFGGAGSDRSPFLRVTLSHNLNAQQLTIPHIAVLRLRNQSLTEVTERKKLE
ncbi:hypothetical protein IQ249_21790 [Lusitaniella coriacea LEGE 07157]|uniref:Uncharacterized protein n=1 Tax=Lusitaniella coriacea LEGE 07157 TaxID=945747 RepID=A0A8J7E2K3_9CYAN|nr:hypothetical protein [Lusitaniella coriacea]MBE9118526.1 hypothetical protein [Lusitaniella coriacea LEGE 07157]